MLLFRFACEEPVGLSVVPLLSYPEGLPPCPISAEVDDPVSDDLNLYARYNGYDFLSTCVLNFWPFLSPVITLGKLFAHIHALSPSSII